MENNFRKLEDGRMRSNFNAGEINRGENKNIKSVEENKIIDSSSAFMPLSENSGQEMASLLSPLKLLSNAWQLYKSRWKTFLGIMIIPALCIIIIAFLLQVGIFWFVGFSKDLISASFVAGVATFFVGAVLFLVLYLAVIIIQLWSQVALIYAIKDSVENIGIKESYRRGWHKIKSFFWVLILSSFIIMGGYMFFVIPGIIFTIWFIFTIYIVVVEDLKGMDAILKSREYIRNYWWSVFWRLSFMTLLLFFISFILTSLSTLILVLAGDSLGTIINLPINIISFILAPLMVIYPFLIYNNLKEIKGDFEFKPSIKLRRTFIFIGVFGNFIGVLITLALIILVSSYLTMFLNLDNVKNKTIDNKYHFNSTPAKKENNDPKIISKENIETRDGRRIFHLSIISTKLHSYKKKNGIYPVSKTAVKLNENNYITNEIKSAISNEDIPLDPKNPEYYYVYKSLDGKNFELTARLENINNSKCDLEIKKDSGICIYKFLN